MNDRERNRAEIMAFLLIVVILLVAAGCGGGQPSEDILGTWERVPSMDQVEQQTIFGDFDYIAFSNDGTAVFVKGGLGGRYEPGQYSFIDGKRIELEVPWGSKFVFPFSISRDKNTLTFDVAGNRVKYRRFK